MPLIVAGFSRRLHGATWRSPGRAVRSVAIATMVMSAGCSGIKRAQECKALVTTINQGVTGLEAVGKSKAGGDAAVVANLKKMAESYEKLAADTSSSSISTPELSAQAKQYAGLAKRSAQAARDFAAAIEAKDAAKAKAAEREFDKLADEESKVVDAMNKTCGG